MNNMIKLLNQGTVNKNIVELGGLRLFFSYETIIAFQDRKGLQCSVNQWSTTTGKFINEIEPVKEARLKPEVFEMYLAETLKAHNLAE